MNKKKNNGVRIAIIVEIILIIIFMWSYADLNAECDGWDCFGKIFPFLLIRVTGISAVINLFIIQILRKKNLVFPIIVVLCIFSAFFIKIYEKEKYIRTKRFEPENSFNNIFHNDSSKTSKYISYFVHNNNLYYYKYDEKYMNLNTDEKGILFKTDFQLNKTDKVCELNNGMNFDFDFIYGNEVFYTTQEEDCEECSSEHNSLRRLNLDTCEEKTIANYDGTTSGQWEYIFGSRNKDEILFYDYVGDISDSKVLYKYNLKENKIVRSGEVSNHFDLVDYDTFDYYYQTYNGVYYNDDLIYRFYDLKYYILSFDTNNIYLYNDNYDYIYALNKESKQMVEKKDFPLKNINNITNVHMFMNNYLYIDNKIYQYDIHSNSFVLIFDNIKEDDLRLFDDSYSAQRNVNGYYLFSDISDLGFNVGDSDIKVVLLIYDNNRNNIIKEYSNGNLINYFIDNDDIYLVNNDNMFKKIETKRVDIGE